MSRSEVPTIPAPASAISEATSPVVFTLFAVFRVSSSHPHVFDGRDVEGVVREFEDVVELIANERVVLRGCYDVSGLRSDADVMVWLHGTAAEDLQWALRELRRTELLRPLVRVWSAVGMHREAASHEEAEVAPTHTPGFVSGTPAKQWLSVYPFERSREWFLLEPAERSQEAAEYRRIHAEFPGVTAHTVEMFSLGDHEWLLALESDGLTELVDTTRALRAISAHTHVRAEAPFFTGRHIEIAELIEVLQ
ncbi:chlorite dismutase family protein [Leucobacter insecticola]|uniref:Coproheme decarboxylase n=1 Tax=Leucobacter insecticola TaxID=2714934 RepID=A0A6G8FGF2_9MICO|nr:hydrogen peroxide-dependent heme synthase [Leucobacter insecticola]QIM15417.1 chlorite dismutase family protein [Leucobacter insecticola]